MIHQSVLTTYCVPCLVGQDRHRPSPHEVPTLVGNSVGDLLRKHCPRWGRQPSLPVTIYQALPYYLNSTHRHFCISAFITPFLNHCLSIHWSSLQDARAIFRFPKSKLITPPLPYTLYCPHLVAFSVKPKFLNFAPGGACAASFLPQPAFQPDPVPPPVP